MKEQWNPPKYQCKVCKKVIFSKYEGDFVTCACPDDTYIFIDSTKYYTRMGGDPAQFEIVVEENNVT